MPTDEPLPRDLQQGLRAAVLALKTARPRGHVPVRVWAGAPGARDDARTPTSAWFEPRPDEPLDQHGRTEVAVALANRVNQAVGDPLLWLTRSGDLDLCPADHRWLAAGLAAWQELGHTPSFALLTRSGWWHHPSGQTRQWRRLRG